MVKEGQETSFYVNGERISFYLQNELSDGIDEALVKHAGLYKSRSQFICCSIARELRRIKNLKMEMVE